MGVETVELLVEIEHQFGVEFSSSFTKKIYYVYKMLVTMSKSILAVIEPL
ncbi:MAG: acyl carrier protein [Polaribacter sp.]|jgi:acyl carrier protein